MNVTEAAIRTSALTMPFSDLAAVDGIDLEVKEGEIFGFLGPNSTGKTTTIRLLLDQLHPTSGNGQVLGLNLREGSLQIRHQIGYLPGDLSLYPKAPGRPGPSRVPTLNRLTAPAVSVAPPRTQKENHACTRDGRRG